MLHTQLLNVTREAPEYCTALHNVTPELLNVTGSDI